MDNHELNILNQLNYPILIIDENSNVLWANIKFSRIYKIEYFISIINKDSFYTDNILKLKNIFYEIKLSKISEGRYIITFFDISKRKLLEDKLLNKQKTFESLSENLPLGIILFSDKITYSNPTFEKMIGYSGKELSKMKFDELFHNDNKTTFNNNIEKITNLKRNNIETIAQITKKNNESLWVNITTKVLRIPDIFIFINVIKNITSEINKTNELEKIANYDKLTEIYNRRKFEEILDAEYKVIKRYKRELSAIFFDIDHFKKINDNYGHDIGDNVLKKLSQLVQNNIRETDIFARWGGEEFIILLKETSKEEAYQIAEKIRKIIMNYNFAQVVSVTISLSVGQFDKERITSFFKKLDNALYNSKKNGRNMSSLI